jgi:MFS family permease
VVATTAQRGKVFAAYMAVSGISMALGQWLILVGDRFGFVPFALASILFSFALVPITLTPVAEPEAMEAPRFVLKELFYISPIGVIGTIGSGLLGGAFYSLGHVFGEGVGFSERGIATFMAATILGGAAFQWPVGHLSDKHDRRSVLFWVCALCACVAGLGFYLAREYEGSLIFLGIIYGGLSFTVYGLSVAHVNDLIESDKVLEVSSGLLLLYGIGSTVGPTLAGGVMDFLGPEALMLYFAIVLGLLAVSVWAFAPAKYIHASKSSHKTDYVVMGSGSQAVLQMDPRRPDFQDSNPPPPLVDPGR